MKKLFVLLLILGCLLSAGLAWAEPPVQVSHTLTGYTMGSDAVTLTYTLKVKNTGAGSISNLKLSLDPPRMKQEQVVTLNIATLDSQTETEIPFTFTTRKHVKQEAARRLPLFWRCEGTVTGIGPVRFPAVSVDRGTR